MTHHSLLLCVLAAAIVVRSAFTRASLSANGAATVTVTISLTVECFVLPIVTLTVQRYLALPVSAVGTS